MHISDSRGNLSTVPRRSTPLSCKQLRNILEGFEFERISRWIHEKKRCLLARLPRDPNVWLNDDLYSMCLESLRQHHPVVHGKDHAAMRHRHAVGIDRILVR